MIIMKIYKRSIVFLLLLSSFLFGQVNDTVTVVPEADFKGSALHNFIFGKHWRDLWTTPLKFPVLDIDSFAGGLTPLKKGGGQQTKSLRFIGKDGHIWKFRSLRKDPSKVLDEDLRNTIVSDVLKDQISSANPLAPLVVAPILNAVGVLQSEPKLYYLPDSEKLGEFREEFANMPGMIEIHPDEEYLEKDPLFENSEKFKGTFKLFEDLETKRHNKIKPEEFLKARLVDAFLGDWDRHTDQWRWARFEDGETKYWYPIPRDRDQAFAKYTGLGPSIAEYYVPQLNDFGYEIPAPKKMMWSGRFLDRRILPEINRTTWDSVATFVANAITDSVIDYAVSRMPEPQYSLAVEEMTGKLKSRRNGLVEFAGEYFGFINKVADVYGSDEDDYVKVDRISDSLTSVVVYRYDDDKKIPYGPARYSRVFENKYTDELRIHLGDEDDYCVITGEVDCSPYVRVIGADGKDTMVDSSVVNGYLFSVFPIPSVENSAKFYDHGGKAKFITGPGTSVDDSDWPEPQTPEERYEPELRDRGYDWIGEPLANANEDDGLVAGVAMNLYHYDFRYDPFRYHMKFSAKYATKPNSYSVGYNGWFNKLFWGLDFDVTAERSKLILTKFYGFGNETPFSEELDDNDYYGLEYEYHNIDIGLSRELFCNFRLRLGAAYNFTEMELENQILLNGFPQGNYGLGNMTRVNFSFDAVYDSRDNERFPSRGIFTEAGITLTPSLYDIKEDYYKGNIDLRFYVPLSDSGYDVMALRAGGSGLSGDYPFYSAAMIGGEDNIRGYNRERFAGDGALFFQSELRAYLTDMQIIIYGKLGFSVFAETGRVFTDIQSEKWHPSYGGSIWASFLDKEALISFSAAYSEENVLFYIDTSMPF